MLLTPCLFTAPATPAVAARNPEATARVSPRYEDASFWSFLSSSPTESLQVSGEPIRTGSNPVDARFFGNHAPQHADFLASRGLFNSSDANAEQLLFVDVDADGSVGQRRCGSGERWPQTTWSRVYLAFDATGTGFENSPASSLGLITTFSIRTFSGGTGVSLSPRAFFVTGRTLVSRTNGISRPFTLR